MPQLPPVTKALLLLCTAIFCVQELLPGVWFGHWMELLALWPVTSDYFLPWQVVTYAFLHHDPLHLFFNMFGLWMFGSEIEMVWGRKRYWQYLLTCAVAGALAQILVSLLGVPSGPTVGASGALYGLLLAFGMMFPERIIVPLFPPIPMKAKYFVALFGGAELFFGVRGSEGGIAHFAHLGGMLGGWLMIRYWRGQAPFPPRRRR
jgi:membrane associated rhomboid family serine protease